MAWTMAERTFAFAEALRHYEGALELWTRVPEAAKLAPLDRITLLERAAEAAHLIHDQDQLAAVLDQVESCRHHLSAGECRRPPARGHLPARNDPGLGSISLTHEDVLT